jgi:hypothetical protein
MNQQLSRILEVGIDGKLYLTIDWSDDEYHIDQVTGINQIQELLFFEVV